MSKTKKERSRCRSRSLLPLRAAATRARHTRCPARRQRRPPTLRGRSDPPAVLQCTAAAVGAAGPPAGVQSLRRSAALGALAARGEEREERRLLQGNSKEKKLTYPALRGIRCGSGYQPLPLSTCTWIVAVSRGLAALGRQPPGAVVRVTGVVGTFERGPHARNLVRCTASPGRPVARASGPLRARSHARRYDGRARVPLTLTARARSRASAAGRRHEASRLLHGDGAV